MLLRSWRHPIGRETILIFSPPPLILQYLWRNYVNNFSLCLKSWYRRICNYLNFSMWYGCFIFCAPLYSGCAYIQSTSGFRQPFFSSFLFSLRRKWFRRRPSTLILINRVWLLFPSSPTSFLSLHRVLGGLIASRKVLFAVRSSFLFQSAPSICPLGPTVTQGSSSSFYSSNWMIMNGSIFDAANCNYLLVMSSSCEHVLSKSMATVHFSMRAPTYHAIDGEG